ncbi:MAG: protein kinase [Actinomycetota bacterium]|nr:protein kinase [Actinomycetota bacterium]
MTQPAPDLPGYRFERLLGSGGYADVYLYRQQLPNRHVAIKVLKAAGLAEDQRRQFTAEANAMAGLADHPNIVSVFSASLSQDGRPYLVMQYYSKPNLSVRAASERLGVAEVLRIGIQIASAVETAHRAGILHRDIKPANLLISQYGAPGLTDFGIAGQLADLDDDEDTGVSVPWTAPEVLYASGPTSVVSDVYSLAATLWHLLVGRSPFEERHGDNSAFALMRRIRDIAPPPVGRPDVPDSLDRLLRQAMSKDAAARPASAIEFARRLQSVEQELTLPRTEIVVTTEAGHGVDETNEPPMGHSTAPSTVARPLAVSPQTPLTYRAAEPGGAVDAPPTNARPETYAAQYGSKAPTRYGPGDIRSSVRSTATVPVQPKPATSRRRSPALLVAGAVVVAGVAVGVGFAVTGTGSNAPDQPKSTVSQTAGTQNAALPGEQIPPGTPKVTGRRVTSGVAVFTWGYSAPQPGDTFAWRETRGTRRTGTAPAPTLRLPVARGNTPTCIQVRVIRSDGTNASATFSPEGCI